MCFGVGCEDREWQGRGLGSWVKEGTKSIQKKKIKSSVWMRKDINENKEIRHGLDYEDYFRMDN